MLISSSCPDCICNNCNNVNLIHSNAVYTSQFGRASCTINGFTIGQTYAFVPPGTTNNNGLFDNNPIVYIIPGANSQFTGSPLNCNGGVSIVEFTATSTSYTLISDSISQVGKPAGSMASSNTMTIARIAPPSTLCNYPVKMAAIVSSATQGADLFESLIPSAYNTLLNANMSAIPWGQAQWTSMDLSGHATNLGTSDTNLFVLQQNLFGYPVPSIQNPQIYQGVGLVQVFFCGGSTFAMVRSQVRGFYSENFRYGQSSTVGSFKLFPANQKFQLIDSASNCCTDPVLLSGGIEAGSGHCNDPHVTWVKKVLDIPPPPETLSTFTTLSQLWCQGSNGVLTATYNLTLGSNCS